MRGRRLACGVGAIAVWLARGCGGSSEESNGATPVPADDAAIDASTPPAPTPDAANDSSCGTVDMRLARPDTGFAYLVRYFAAGGDTDAEPSRSNVVVFEDGHPLATAHAPIADVRTMGAGRYRHYRETLSLSASDNTDPRTNGRTYTWGVPSGTCPITICGRIDATTAGAETGFNFILEKSFGFAGDTLTSPQRSGLSVFEDGNALGPPHALHDDIRAQGHGRFSHWGNSLYFSSSDGSSPKDNGREYLYGGPCRRLADVVMTNLSDAAPGYATFQSHNQKVIENANGIFLTYLHQATPSGLAEAYGDRHKWRLLRSTDHGSTFSTVFEESVVGKAPVVETDEDGDVYVIASDIAPTGPTAGAGIFYHFTAASGFAAPTPVTFAGGGAGKYAAVYDPTRKCFYFFTYNGGGPNLYTLDKAGNVTATIQLVSNGPVGLLQYPHLAMRGSTLFAAWTTSKADVYLYWDIHFAKSEDGGKTWQKLDGTALTLPIVSDDSGPADGMVLPDELGFHNWLSSFIPKGDSVHFMYLSQLASPREHHVRWDRTPAATIGRNRYPLWSGGELAIGNLDGFFTSADDGPDSLLYAVSAYQNGAGDFPRSRVVVLASDDNGTTWFDYALGPPLTAVYAIGGARRTSGGYIAGTLTDIVEQDPNNKNGQTVWFFRVKAE